MREAQVHCMMCGQPVAKGTGMQEPEPEFSAEQHKERATYEHEQKTMPPEFGGWRWTCGACVEDRRNGTQYSSALRALIGVEEPETVAQRVLDALVKVDWNTGEYSGHIAARDCGRVGKKPWAHVDQRALDDINAAYAVEKVRGLPATSNRGACGMCGVRSALGGWTNAPARLTWPDGSPVAFCASCTAVWMLRGEPTFIEDLRKVGAEAATGKPIGLPYSAPEGFRLFCESRAADREGLESPWSWSEKLTAYRESVWMWNLDLAPENLRGDLERRREAKMLEARLKTITERREVAARAW